MGHGRRSGSIDDAMSSKDDEDQEELHDDLVRKGTENGGGGGEESDDTDVPMDNAVEVEHAEPSRSAAAIPSNTRTRKDDESGQGQSTDDNDDESIDEEEDADGGREAEDVDDVKEREKELDDRDEKKSRAVSKDSTKTKKPKVHKLSLAKTEDFNEKLRKRGVVYVARIPPRMTPTKVKALLGEHGEVTRVYLVEEDAAIRRKRRKLHGGNGSKRYTEGWVEFASKQVAKHVAASLNASAITHYKRSPHYGDLWSLKYLQGFKWSHLTEKVAYERRVREQKLRLETMQARRDTVAYKQLVETGKKLDKIEERKRRREEKQGVGGSGGGGGGGAGSDSDKNKKAKYTPKQVSQIDADSSQRGASKKPLLGSLL